MAPIIRALLYFIVIVALANMLEALPGVFSPSCQLQGGNISSTTGCSSQSAQAALVAQLSYMSSIFVNAAAAGPQPAPVGFCANSNCSTGLAEYLVSTAGTGQSDATCKLHHMPDAVRQLAHVVTDFSCTSDPVSGPCLYVVASAFRGAGLLELLRSLPGNITLTGSLLAQACAALQPTGCCAPAAAHLLSALSSQLCKPSLAQEFLSLAGRCATAGIPLAPNTCSSLQAAGWPGVLTSLISPPTSARPCQSEEEAAFAADLWTGAACTPQQLAATSCPASICDAWCAIIGSAPGLAGSLQAVTLASTVGQSSSTRAALSPQVTIYVGFMAAFCFLAITALIIVLVWRSRMHTERVKLSATTAGSKGAGTRSVAAATPGTLLVPHHMTADALAGRSGARSQYQPQQPTSNEYQEAPPAVAGSRGAGAAALAAAAASQGPVSFLVGTGAARQPGSPQQPVLVQGTGAPLGLPPRPPPALRPVATSKEGHHTGSAAAVAVTAAGPAVEISAVGREAAAHGGRASQDEAPMTGDTGAPVYLRSHTQQADVASSAGQTGFYTPTSSFSISRASTGQQGRAPRASQASNGFASASMYSAHSIRLSTEQGSTHGPGSTASGATAVSRGAGTGTGTGSDRGGRRVSHLLASLLTSTRPASRRGARNSSHAASTGGASFQTAASGMASARTSFSYHTVDSSDISSLPA